MSRTRFFFLWLAQLALAAVFIAAAAAKIRDPEGFALAIHRYRLIPGGGVNALAILLPWLEMVAGLAVLGGWSRWRKAGAFWLLLLLGLFTAAISLNMIRGIESSCGCFSTRADAAVSDAWNLLRNACLLWLAATVFFTSLAPARPSSPGQFP